MVRALQVVACENLSTNIIYFEDSNFKAHSRSSCNKMEKRTNDTSFAFL